MRKMIVFGIATVGIRRARSNRLSTHAQAAAPANYSRACTEVVASVVSIRQLVEKAAYGVARVRRDAPFAGHPRRHGY